MPIPYPPRVLVYTDEPAIGPASCLPPRFSTMLLRTAWTPLLMRKFLTEPQLLHSPLARRMRGRPRLQAFRQGAFGV